MLNINRSRGKSVGSSDGTAITNGISEQSAHSGMHVDMLLEIDYMGGGALPFLEARLQAGMNFTQPCSQIIML